MEACFSQLTLDVIGKVGTFCGEGCQGVGQVEHPP